VSKAEKGTNFADILGGMIASRQAISQGCIDSGRTLINSSLVKKDMVFGVLVYRRLNSPPEKRISLTESAFEKFMGVSEDTIKHQKAKEEIEHPSINSPEEVTLLM
jgi:hypothetical protein